MAKDLGENFTDAEIREMVKEADRDSKFLNFLFFVQCLGMIYEYMIITKLQVMVKLLWKNS